MTAPRPDVRRALRAAFGAAVQACDPEEAVRHHLLDRPLPAGSVRVIAIGKAAPAMARGAADVLGERLVGGVAVSDHTETMPAAVRLLIGGHPLPDDRSEQAGRAAMAEAATRDHDHLLVLISGGGSALAEIPAEGLTVAHVAGLTRALMEAGAPIGRLNTVRRHLSQFKNGGLLQASLVPVTTLLIDDVAGGPPSDIASGPTLADATTAADVLAVLEDLHVDPTITEFLHRPPEHGEPEPAHTWDVVVDRRTAMTGAGRSLEQAGYPTRVEPNALVGPAADQAIRFVAAASSGAVTIAAGETTVEVTGAGLGGRNQHAALAVALAIDGRDDIVFAAFGTDGIDGPTPAAGAIVDGGAAERIRQAGLDPETRLAACDSHRALEASGDLVVTGPTGTNIGDLWMVWRE